MAALAMSLAEIKNFLPVTARIATAGQPTEAQLGAVAAAGYTLVINLGLLDPKYCLPDEAGLVARLGMAYRHIPVVFDDPRADDFVAFVAAMDGAGCAAADDPGGSRVFVHCAANYRVSTFIALYGQMRLGWTRGQADAHAQRLWQPNPIWAGFRAACQARFIDSPGSPSP
jgi:protein tyrosine phosphatase (PTP) superfamily phosphohydrolase (DUF442 family)